MNKILITDPLRSRDDFYAALGTCRGCGHVPAPKNLDSLADFCREHHLTDIVCAHWDLDRDDSSALLGVLNDQGVVVHR